MPNPVDFAISLYARDSITGEARARQIEFKAYPSASCTLAQHYAAKMWYELQEILSDSPTPASSPTSPKEGLPE